MMNIMKLVIILIHAFVGWALCAATIGIGMATMSLQNALIIQKNLQRPFPNSQKVEMAFLQNKGASLV
jgi:hypothetical protein